MYFIKLVKNCQTVFTLLPIIKLKMEEKYFYMKKYINYLIFLWINL